MDFEKKKAVVEELKRIVNAADAMVLLSHTGLTVEEATKIRREIEGSGGRLRVVKNTLFARALEETGASFLREHLAGPLALAYTESDPAGLAKTIINLLKANQKLGFKGGAVGRRPLTEEGLKVLSTLPPLQTIRGMLLGVLDGVPRKFLSVLQAPARSFLAVLKAREQSLAGGV